MQNPIPTISIGIPAYNEEQSIKNLLQFLVRQQGANFILKEIIVISDGSTDNTVQQAKSVADKRKVILDDKIRKGKSARLNEIFRLFTGDILILCDADITIENTELFSTIIEKVNFTKAGVAAPKFLAIKPRNFLEKCLKLSVDLQLEIMEGWNEGNNYLSFRGAMLVLDKKLAKNLHMPNNVVNNDAYIYFKALTQQYHPVYMSWASVFYKVPSTLKDYRNQSSRYQDSYEELRHYLPVDKRQYKIPTSLYIRCMMRYFLLHPVLFVSYIFLRYYIRITKNRSLTTHWTMATTTKIL